MVHPDRTTEQTSLVQRNEVKETVEWQCKGKTWEVEHTPRIMHDKLMDDGIKDKLMVTINQMMDMDEDINDLNDANGRLQTKIDGSYVAAVMETWTLETQMNFNMITEPKDNQIKCEITK